MSAPILAIETSCDETAAAVVAGRRILSSVIASQAELHAPYGGVVPEVAARHHLGTVNAVVDRALEEAGLELEDVDRIAVTQSPGLIGALLVGVATAKSLAYATGKPLVMVDHLAGHIAALWLEPVALDPPFVSLIASGGHTRLDLVTDYAAPRMLGQTIDDAAGEAIDKGARLLGLGYPGGPALERLAATGDRGAHRFPIGLEGRGRRDFSFAGVKTALLYSVRELGEAVEDGPRRPGRLLPGGRDAAAVGPPDRRRAGGGRAARSRWPAASPPTGACASWWGRPPSAPACAWRCPTATLCTDNAAMIGAAAQFAAAVPWPDYVGLDAMATAPPEASRVRRLWRPRAGERAGGAACRAVARRRRRRRLALAAAGPGRGGRAGGGRAATAPTCGARRSPPPPAGATCSRRTGRRSGPPPATSRRRSCCWPARRRSPRRRPTAPRRRPRSRPARRRSRPACAGSAPRSGTATACC